MASEVAAEEEDSSGAEPRAPGDGGGGARYQLCNREFPGPRQATGGAAAPAGTTPTTPTTPTPGGTAGPPAPGGLAWDLAEDSCWATLSGEFASRSEK